MPIVDSVPAGKRGHLKAKRPVERRSAGEAENTRLEDALEKDKYKGLNNERGDYLSMLK